MPAPSDSRVAELIGDRPLSARSVLASTLLGFGESGLTAAHLVAVASRFGISDGAARTCLWRMASQGELTVDDGRYVLAGRLAERRQRVDEANRVDDVAEWDGTWELAIVSAERRRAADRVELRKAAMALHLADFREGVWIRPDNLDSHRLSASRAVLDRQCTHFHGAATDITADRVRSLFALDGWADDARALIDAMEVAHSSHPRDETAESFTYEFALSAAVVRHLQRDPLLPAQLVQDDWPGNALRGAYHHFERALKKRMHRIFE